MHAKRKATFTSKHKSLKWNGKIGSYSHLSFLEDWVSKGFCLLNSLTLDYEVNKDDLLSELQSIRSTHTLAIDHQCQVIANVKKDASNNKIGMQSMTVVSNLGLILNYIVIPSTATD